MAWAVNSLVKNVVEVFFRCIFVICLSYRWSFYSKFFPFFYYIVCPLIEIWWRWLSCRVYYTFWIQVFCQKCVLQILSALSVACLFLVLWCLLKSKSKRFKFLWNLFYVLYSFRVYAFCLIAKKTFSILKLQRLSSMFFLEVSWFWT